MTSSLALRVVVAQLGARQHYEIARMCFRDKALVRMHTDFWKPVPKLFAPAVARLGGKVGVRAIGRSSIDIPPAEFVEAHSLPAIYWHIRLAMARNRATLFDIHRRWDQQFARRVAKSLESEKFTTFFGFSSASLEAIETARSMGALTVLDVIAPFRIEDDLVSAERERFAGWERAFRPTPSLYLERLAEEMQAAERILVNSNWSRSALVRDGVSADKICVVPISYQPSYETEELKRRSANESLRVLWLGTLCLRKGFPYALDAARRLENAPVEFTFAGPSDIDLREISWPSNCRYIGQIPRNETRDLWHRHHVFLLPTLSDGFAITQIEAIAHGLPLIVTENCGDVVEDGKCGFVVAPRDSRAIVRAIEAFLGGEVDLESASFEAAKRAQDFRPAAVWRQLRPVLTPRLGNASHASPCGVSGSCES